MYNEATSANINFRWTGSNAFQALGAFCELVESLVLDTPVGYSECGCDRSSTCIAQSSIWSSQANMETFYVPGFYIGCYVIEALLQSTLQCFYDQTCMDQLQLYLPSASPMNVTALNSSLPSQYFENSTIENLLNKLMIEEWNSTQMYDRYYDECQPIECTYTVKTRNSVIYIITTMFGIIGGLITVLSCVVPQVVKVFNVTGFYVGCYTTEALLRSTLECFYNQTCIDKLQLYLLSPSPMNVTALDSSLSSQYSQDSTIEYLLNNLMIEEWNPTQMYDQYYNECQPIECTYTIRTRNNILYVITTLIGIIGGLTRVSKILVPLLVKIIVYCFRKWRSRVVPQISIIQT
ncbi:unnamed protein product [Adineta steineri]|uniref:Uncharacterized protein n=1 Tax=Adineta steineri TaxID=433720 RepID=A0A814D8Z9_9BILA|nr:unnamed protein product [Adineta steineri]CAF3520071.1 unnamed protein product [Adineta steineri]